MMGEPGDVMRAMAYASSQRQAEYPCLWSALKALNLARRSMRKGHVEDVGLLLSLIGIAADLCGTDQAGLKLDLEGEGVAWVSILADQGVELAEYPLHWVVQETHPEAVRRSKTYRKLILEGQE